ncbi:MAG TPA: hypothetical protein VGD07_07830 [Methylomirabilota bacterium]|jgi:hypothetical protein
MKKKSGGKKATKKPRMRDLSPLDRGSRRVKGGAKRLGRAAKRI